MGASPHGTFAPMRTERGQATVEWIGLVLLLALTLAGLSRLVPSAEGQDVGATLAHSLSCAARGGCRGPQVVRPQVVRPQAVRPPVVRRQEAFTAPPLVPHQSEIPRQAARNRIPSAGELLRRWARGAARELPRLRRAAGGAWRRAWIACLVYERFRYAFLHPESRLPGHSIPPSELLRIANDCISPVDLVRDWPLMRGR